MLPSLQQLSYRLVQRLTGVDAGAGEAVEPSEPPGDEAVATDTRPTETLQESPKRQRVDESAREPVDRKDGAVEAPIEVRSRNVGGEHLAIANAHEADKDARFVESTHRYYVRGVLVPTSVTSVVHSVLPDDFDAARTVDRYFDRWKGERDPRYWPIISQHVARGDDAAAKRAIVDSWTAAGNTAKTLGTALHLYAELRMNQPDATFGRPLAPSVFEPPHPSYDPEIAAEVEQFERFMQSKFVIEEGLRPYRTELTTWYSKNGTAVVAGQIDALLVDKRGRYYIFDWKRVASKKVLSASARPQMRRVEVEGGRWAYRPVMGERAAADIAVTDHNKYSFQTSMYAVMLKQSHDIDVGDRLYLVRMHSDRPEYELIRCTDFRAQAAATIEGL